MTVTQTLTNNAAPNPAPSSTMNPTMNPTSQARSNSKRVRPIRFRHLVRGEWIKFRSVRSSTVTLLAAGLVTVAFGMIFTATAGSDTAPGPAAQLSDPVSLSLGAVTLTQMIVGVLGVLLVAGEYSTGLIRTSVASVGRRVRLLGAKSVVVGAATAAVMAVATTGAAWLGQAVYAGDQPTMALSDPDLIGLLVGSTAYLTGIALMGVALGSIFRSTAGAIGVLFGGVFIGPQLLQLLPDSFTDVVLKYLPSEAGGVLMTANPDPGLLSTTWSAVVFGAWVFGLQAVAGALLRVRDV